MPRCFYQQRRLGLAQPRMVPLTLAVATDALLKNEFDAIRGANSSHPIWEKFNLNVSAYAHDEIENWRNNFRGMRIFHEATNMEIFGAVDDIWQHNETGHLHIVDYKSTSKKANQPLKVADLVMATSVRWKSISGFSIKPALTPVLWATFFM